MVLFLLSSMEHLVILLLNPSYDCFHLLRVLEICWSCNIFYGLACTKSAATGNSPDMEFHQKEVYRFEKVGWYTVCITYRLYRFTIKVA